MDNRKRTFFELVKAGLWGNGDPEIRIDGTKDWGEVYQLAKEQSVQGLVLQGIEAARGLGLRGQSSPLVPKELLLQWIGEVQILEQQNKAMNDYIADLVKKMRDADIYTLLVKGQGVAQCYEKPLWRVCGDIDFLLSDESYEKAKFFLVPLASEFETEYIGAKHLGMTINGWVVELHGSLRVGLPNRINRVLDEIQRDTFYNGNVRSWNNNGTQVYLLGKENDIVYVFVHFLNHFYKEGVGLRQICDWCRLMWTYRDSLNQGLLESRIRKMGLTTEWKAFYNLASRYLGMPDLGSGLMIHDPQFDKKADRIMEFLIKSGNMGHNRNMSHFSKYPYIIRKCVSMGRRIGDLINHAKIFPLDSLIFFPTIMFNGLRSAVKGE